MTRRGGPQRIPRPEGWALGGPAPWADSDRSNLSTDRIESALAARGPGQLRGVPPTPDTRRSAVLVPLYEEEGEAHVILTRRSPNLRSHTHEVSFPGGRVDPTDVDDWDTALREAHEEVALDRALPRRIGDLDSFVAGGSQTYVTPVVAVLPHRPTLTPSEAEVEHILYVPLGELLLPEVFREEIWIRDGVTHRITFFELHGDTVWGATGTMLRELLGIVTGVGHDPPLL